MFRKIALSSSFGIIEDDSAKVLLSVTSNNKVLSFKYDPDNFVYFRCRAITADTPNANGDYFPEEEVKKAYKTFIGVGVYKDHNADSVNKAIGKILWAEYIPEGKYVELIGCVDKRLDPETARKIATGIIDSVSMGCVVSKVECSICGKEAYTPKDYCEHLNPINGLKGRILSNGKQVYEINKGIQFVELSLVTNPADKTARVFEVVAKKKEAKQAESFNDFINKLTYYLRTNDYNEFIKMFNDPDLIKKFEERNYKNYLYFVKDQPTKDDFEIFNTYYYYLLGLQHPFYQFTHYYYSRLRSFSKDKAEEFYRRFGEKIEDAYLNLYNSVNSKNDGGRRLKILALAIDKLINNGFVTPFIPPRRRMDYSSTLLGLSDIKKDSFKKFLITGDLLIPHGLEDLYKVLIYNLYKKSTNFPMPKYISDVIEDYVNLNKAISHSLIFKKFNDHNFLNNYYDFIDSNLDEIKKYYSELFKIDYNELKNINTSKIQGDDSIQILTSPLDRKIFNFYKLFQFTYNLKATKWLLDNIIKIKMFNSPKIIRDFNSFVNNENLNNNEKYFMYMSFDHGKNRFYDPKLNNFVNKIISEIKDNEDFFISINRSNLSSYFEDLYYSSRVKDVATGLVDEFNKLVAQNLLYESIVASNLNNAIYFYFNLPSKYKKLADPNKAFYNAFEKVYEDIKLFKPEYLDTKELKEAFNNAITLNKKFSEYVEETDKKMIKPKEDVKVKIEDIDVDTLKGMDEVKFDIEGLIDNKIKKIFYELEELIKRDEIKGDVLIRVVDRVLTKIIKYYEGFNKISENKGKLFRNRVLEYIKNNIRPEINLKEIKLKNRDELTKHINEKIKDFIRYLTGEKGSITLNYGKYIYHIHFIKRLLNPIEIKEETLKEILNNQRRDVLLNETNLNESNYLDYIEKSKSKINNALNTINDLVNTLGFSFGESQDIYKIKNEFYREMLDAIGLGDIFKVKGLEGWLLTLRNFLHMFIKGEEPEKNVNFGSVEKDILNYINILIQKIKNIENVLNKLKETSGMFIFINKFNQFYDETIYTLNSLEKSLKYYFLNKVKEESILGFEKIIKEKENFLNSIDLNFKFNINIEEINKIVLKIEELLEKINTILNIIGSNKKLSNLKLFLESLKNKLNLILYRIKEKYKTSKKIKLFLEKYSNIDEKVKFFYRQGSGFKTSKIIAVSGNKKIAVGLWRVLPIEVMEDIMSNKDTKFTPEDLLDNLNNKFSTIKSFLEWLNKKV